MRNGCRPGTHLHDFAYFQTRRINSFLPGSINAVADLNFNTTRHITHLKQFFFARASTNFIKLKDCKTAQQILTDSLNKRWNSELVTLFGDCLGSHNLGQIEQAEKWLSEHPDDAGLLLALGKLCLHDELWGKAQNYLDASISLTPCRAAYYALASLAKKLGNAGDASKYQHMAMAFE